MQLRFLVAACCAAGVMASSAWAEETSSNVEKCSKSFGTLAVAEPQTGWGHIQRYGLGSPAALLRMMVQQSGCFDVVERGVAMQNLQQERALMQQGELRAESNVGQGQMQAADFVMTPNVQVAASDTGGVGGALLGRLGMLGAIAGSLKFKEASTSLLVADVRSSLQVASAEGKATKTDFGVGGWAFGGGVLGGLGGYTKTPEGKMVAASLLDNYNKIVLAIRDQSRLTKNSSAAADANAAAATRAEAPQPAGQMLQAKIANVKAYADASREAAVVANLQKTDELVATGEVRNGFIKVDAANFSGWVQRTLVAPVNGPAAVPVAQAPVPLVHAAPAVGIVGSYSGQFTGSDQGSFQVQVLSNGQITGQGQSVSTGGFAVQGRMDATGMLTMSAQGSAGMAVFNGRVDLNTGQITGTWRILPRGGSGTFAGQRQP